MLWLVVGIATVLLIVGVALLRRSRGRVEPGRVATAIARPPGQSWTGTGDPATQMEADGLGAAQAPRFDPTTCWRELDRFNEGVTIENFRAWAAALLASSDEHVQSYLKERLTELIGADAGQRAGAVLGWVRAMPTRKRPGCSCRPCAAPRRFTYPRSRRSLPR